MNLYYSCISYLYVTVIKYVAKTNWVMKCLFLNMVLERFTSNRFTPYTMYIQRAAD